MKICSNCGTPITESEAETKRIIFEFYRAGFEDGYSQENDIDTAYDKYWDNLMIMVRIHEQLERPKYDGR